MLGVWQRRRRQTGEELRYVHWPRYYWSVCSNSDVWQRRRRHPQARNYGTCTDPICCTASSMARTSSGEAQSWHRSSDTSSSTSTMSPVHLSSSSTTHSDRQCTAFNPDIGCLTRPAACPPYYRLTWVTHTHTHTHTYIERETDRDRQTEIHTHTAHSDTQCRDTSVRGWGGGIFWRVQ